MDRPGTTPRSRAGPLRSRTGVMSMTTAGVPVAPSGVAPHRGSTSHMGAKRAGNYQPPRTSTPLNRSGTSLRICSAQVRTAAGGGVPGHSQSGCYPGDQHGLTAQGTQPPLHRRAGQPRPWLSQGRGVLPPHPAAVGTGKAPPTHHQLRKPPPHRHVGQTAMTRLGEYWLRSTPPARRPDTGPPSHEPAPGPRRPYRTGPRTPVRMRHSITAHSTVRCWPTTVNHKISRPRKVIRSGPMKVASGTSRSLNWVE